MTTFSVKQIQLFSDHQIILAIWQILSSYAAAYDFKKEWFQLVSLTYLTGDHQPLTLFWTLWAVPLRSSC